MLSPEFATSGRLDECLHGVISTRMTRITTSGDAREKQNFFFPAFLEAFLLFTDLQPLLLLVAPAAAWTAFDATGQEGRVVASRAQPISWGRGQLHLGGRLGNCLFLFCD